MKLLLSVANALNAVYRTLLFTWLIYVLVQKLKHRRDMAQFESPQTPRRLH